MDYRTLKSGFATAVIPLTPELRKLGKLPDGPGQVLVRKYGLRQVHKSSPFTGETTAIISAETRDRDGDRILASGWKLGNYRKNPVVLWAHDYTDLPVGKGQVRIDRTAKTLVGVTQWLEHPFAKEVASIYQDAHLGGFSVGYIPDDFGPDEMQKDEELPPGRRIGSLFKRQELVEFSATPVPAHPEAVEAFQKAMVGDPDGVTEFRRILRAIAKANRITRCFLSGGDTQGDVLKVAPLRKPEHEEDPPPDPEAEEEPEEEVSLESLAEKFDTLAEGLTSLAERVTALEPEEEEEEPGEGEPAPEGEEEESTTGPKGLYSLETLVAAGGLRQSEVELLKLAREGRKVARQAENKKGGET